MATATDTDLTRRRRAAENTTDTVGRLMHGAAGYLGSAWFWLDEKRRLE